jgi:hypothetical protein
VLAATQPSYAPAKAGAQMDLVSAPNATAVTAIQSGLSKPGTAQTITANQNVNVNQWNGGALPTIGTSTLTTTDLTNANNAQTTSLETYMAGTGVVLAATQPSYAPAKAGAQMDLVSAPNATAVTAIQSGLATATDVAAIQSGGLDTAALIADGVLEYVSGSSGPLRFTAAALAHVATATAINITDQSDIEVLNITDRSDVEIDGDRHH